MSQACCKGELDKQVLQWRQSAHAVGVVIASKGYPESSSKGDVITGKGVRLIDNNRGLQFKTVNIKHSCLKCL